MPTFAKSSKRNYLSVSLVIVLLCAASNNALQAAPQPKKDTKTHEHDVRMVRSLIANCPLWCALWPGRPQTEAAKRKIFQTLDQIAAYDDDTIEAAVAMYTLPRYQFGEDSGFNFESDTHAIYTVSLVARYLYDVPEKLPMKGLPKNADFHLAYKPRDGQVTDGMSPLFYRSDGLLDIHTILMGPQDFPYSGKTMVNGFEYCQRHFARRTQRRHI